MVSIHAGGRVERWTCLPPRCRVTGEKVRPVSGRRTRRACPRAIGRGSVSLVTGAHLLIRRDHYEGGRAVGLRVSREMTVGARRRRPLPALLAMATLLH